MQGNEGQRSKANYLIWIISACWQQGIHPGLSDSDVCHLALQCLEFSKKNWCVVVTATEVSARISNFVDLEEKPLDCQPH